MSIATVLDSVKTAQRERLDAKVDTFEQLAWQMADDAILDPDSVVETLDQCGRTAEELATAAQGIVDRREWAKQLQEDAALVAEHNGLVAKETAANEELAETIRQARFSHAQKVGPIQARIVAITFARDVGQTARNRLVQTSPARGQLATLCAERGAFVIALQGELARQLRQAMPGAVGNVEAEIRRAEAERDRLSVEIARLEQEALRP